ncbi:MAG: NifU family protein [Candidatus Hydrogenedentes bacterium]|nr:NifU family protein [Candidatus Hydrogenedentota bacterium]
MAAWFSKVFKTEDPTKNSGNAVPAPVKTVATDRPAAYPEGGAPSPHTPPSREVDDLPKARKLVSAPILLDETEVSAWSDEIRIKAKLDPHGYTIVFLVDRPVLEGHSFMARDQDGAFAHSPLAASIFDLGGIVSVLIHNMTVTVNRDGRPDQSVEEAAREIGAQIRAHLKSGMPVLDPAYLDQMPPVEEIRAGLQKVLDREINPGIASHSGYITLNRVEGNTAYITMGGGCQGCAASSMTLRQGVESAFRLEVPFLGALLDETDHTAGINPFFKELPAGMGR